MCASYNPPNEYITQFNTRLFNQPEDTLSQAEANQLYLSKRTSDTSTAPLTTFQGQVSFNNEAPISNTTPSIPSHLATLAYLTSYYQPIANMSSYLLISVATSTYQTIAGMSDYLTTASAASIYQPISLMVNYLTTASAASTYQPISLMVNYLTTAVASTTYLTIANAASTYLSITNAASTYQPISLMVNYLTTAVASTTYLTIANAASTYLSITNAASTYLTQANAALTYLTIATASSTYQTIANMTNYVSRTGNVTENISGLKTFTNNIEVFNSSNAFAEPSLILRQAVGEKFYSTIKYTGTNLQFFNNNSDGNIIFYTGGTNARLNISFATTTINNALTCQSQATFNTLCPISSVSPSQDNHLTRRDFVLGQQFTTLSLVQSNANTFSSTTTFSVIPICSVNASGNNQLVNWQTLNGQQFTTLTLVQSNNNTFTGTNQFNQPIKIQYAAAQYTDLEQSAQVFNIYNRSASGSIYIRCRNSSTTTDNIIAQFQTTGITLGLSSGTNTINGNSTTFNHQVSITGNLTAGAALLSNTISGQTTFNQDVTLSGTLTAGTALLNNTISGPTTFNQAVSITGLLTANGGLKTNAITPLVGSGQNDIYAALPTGGTIVFGTASRTMSIYGIVNMVNSCQFSNALQTNDITYIGTQSNSAKNIYINLTTGGSVTLGSNTANTTTNIRGGAISIGGSTNTLTIESPTTFNNTLKTDDITPITAGNAQSIYTGLTTGGSVTIGSTTANTTTNIRGGAISIGGSSNLLTIESPTTFNNTLKTDDITPITAGNSQSIYTGLTSGGSINLGETTAGTITNIKGGEINIGHSTINCNVLSNFVCNNNATFKAGFYLTDIGSGLPTDNALIVQQDNVLRFDTNVNYANTYEFWIQSNLIFSIEAITSYIYNTLNIIGSLKIRNDKLVDELQTLTTANEVLVFPLQQTTIFTNTGNISVTLPLINNDTQIGLRFTFLNLGSVSTITTFTAQSTNKIITIGQVTQNTSSTALINNANNSCSLVIVKLSGVYCWAEYI